MRAKSRTRESIGACRVRRRLALLVDWVCGHSSSSQDWPWKEGEVIDPDLWIAFVGTVILLQMPPGPDSMLVMARGIGQGRGVALFTVLGMTVGAGMVQLPLIALGVTTLIKGSPLAFAALK